MRHITKIIFSLAFIALISSCSQNDQDVSIESVSINSAKELVSEDESVVVLDVRTPEEFAAGHIQDAINININDDDFSDKVSNLDHNKTYIVHCGANAKNGRTDKSLKIMDGLGFDNLLDLSGGIAKWIEQGNPVVTSTN